MFFAGTDDQRLLYIDNRLSNRRTFCEFDFQLMGPIIDTRGLEQGGVYSSDAYKIYNNEQNNFLHASSLGVRIYDQCISCISLADDNALVASSLTDLNNLLHLTVLDCKRNDVDLVPDKTNLIAFNVTSHYDLRTNLTESSNLKFVFEVYVRSLPLTLEFEAEVLNQI